MFSKHKSSLFAAAILGMLFMVPGCGDGVAVKSKPKAIPKQDFHKPESFQAAVKRIRELHNAIASDEPLPKALSYTVVEVSHSHGNGNAHVHYHLDEDGDHDHEHGDDHDGHDHGDHDDHGHSHDDPFSPRHTVTVDVFTELKDAVRWLPDIASDGDLPQDKWKQAKALSKDMTSHLETVAGAGMPSVQRTSYQSDAANMDKWIVKLESLVVPTTDQVENGE